MYLFANVVVVVGGVKFDSNFLIALCFHKSLSDERLVIEGILYKIQFPMQLH